MRMGVICFALVGLSTFANMQPAHAQVQERTIRWGHLNNTDHPISFGVQKFAEVLAAKSGGKLKIREFAASQLGNEMQQQSAVRGGTQEVFSASTTSLAGVIKELGLFDFPFIVSTFDQAEALANGAFGQTMIDALPDKDLIGLGYWGLGFRNATNSSHPIARLEDFAGLKLRVIPNPVYLETFKALKANPVPMAFGELYTALENKTVDGQENPYSVILSNKFYEVQKFVSATNHTFTQNIIIVSKKFWDRLSPEEQKMFRDTFAETKAYQREQTKLAADKALAELTAKGMQFNEIAPAEYARMQDATKPVIEKFSAEYDPAKVKLFNDEARPTDAPGSGHGTMDRSLLPRPEGHGCALPCRHGRSGFHQCRIAVRVQLRHRDLGGTLPLAAGLAHLPRCDRRLATARSSRGRYAGARAATARQTALLRHQLCPDALCGQFVDHRQLEAGCSDLP
jgi:tripartite ATP-independent transporter DctP family solute receptor